MPGVASFSDAAKNIGSSINIGYDAVDRLYGNHTAADGMHAPFNIKSVGGALTLGGLAPIGAAAGAALGMFGDGADIGTYAMTGAAIGAGATLAVGATAAIGYNAAKGAGNLLYNFATSNLANSGSAGEKAASMLKPVGNFAAGLINGVNAEGLGATALSPVRRYVNGLAGLGKSLVKFDEDAMNISDVKLTKFGAAALTGATMYEGFRDALQASEKIHMGQSDGMITTASPRVPSYANNAGATGDLVFALNKNRRG